MQNEKKNDRYKLILARNHVGKNDRDSQERGTKKRVEVYYDREKETFTVTNGGVPNGKNNVNEQEPLKKIVEKYFVKPKEKNKESEKKPILVTPLFSSDNKLYRNACESHNKNCRKKNDKGRLQVQTFKYFIMLHYAYGGGNKHNRHNFN